DYYCVVWHNNAYWVF
nr:immunoglobulin light chain junction region [Macaca mulatta]MOY05015.1 immunoglobulin light chain junction region [Macaca mulatta]MOY05431.1 immunoglobulin light chain junction region [Macaca mulatta]MOY05812.1 immunoglobulin light chain junction region [Macaca mulatta]MOY06277.1 immunoglobulin light chain junction region [Macaca mulatta]